MRLDLDRLPALLAAATFLLLSGPGVQVVRADDPLVSSEPEAPVCRAGQPNESDANVSAVLAKLEALAAEAEETPTGDLIVGNTPDGQPIIVLNNAGYNYGGGARGDVRAMQAELAKVLQERAARQ